MADGPLSWGLSTRRPGPAGKSVRAGGASVALVASALFVLAAGAGHVASAATPGPINVLKKDFSQPAAMAVVGDDLFVADLGGQSLTEVDGLTGAVVTVLSDPKYEFDRPSSILRSGPELFVANNYGNSVTELDAATGALVRVISGAAYHFDGPESLALTAGHLFVANEYNDSVTELTAATGTLVRVIVGAAYHFDRPLALVAAGAHIFVASYGMNATGPNGTVVQVGAAVTELSASSGALVKVLSGSAMASTDRSP